jgi:ectoine hydroxylase-related dioxygenase (phytanoyl-CoA dioxygenase family)
MNIEKIRETLANDGFCLIRGLMKDSQSLSNIQEKLTCLVRSKTRMVDRDCVNPFDFESPLKIVPSNGTNLSAYLNDEMNKLPDLSRLLLDHKIFNLIKHYFNSEKISHNNYRFRIQMPGHDVTANLPWHQDAHYNSKDTPGRSLVVWFSISKILHSQGPIIFRRGSHLAGRAERLDFIRPNGKRIYTVTNNVLNDGLSEISHETDPGDIILIHMYNIHKSGHNNSEFTKVSAQIRYHSEKG